MVWITLPEGYFWGYLVAALILLSIAILTHIKRHESAVEQSFQVAVLLGIASYWLPPVVLLIIPMWGYLYYRNLFDTRCLMASLIGFAMMALWVVVLHWIGMHYSVFSFPLPWLEFWVNENAWGWIPTGALLLAWLGTTIVQQTLRER